MLPLFKYNAVVSEIHFCQSVCMQVRPYMSTTWLLHQILIRNRVCLVSWIRIRTRFFLDGSIRIQISSFLVGRIRIITARIRIPIFNIYTYEYIEKHIRSKKPTNLQRPSILLLTFVVSRRK